MVQIIRQISQYNYEDGNDIQYIVMHFTGNSNDSASGNANYFNACDRGASAHYFVDDNIIYQVVEDGNSSWHCGDGNGVYGISNYNSIGIEMCGTNGDISEKTAKNARDLVRVLMKKYGVSIDRVIRHYDASRKNCPSPYSPNNWTRWNDFKNKIVNEVEEDEMKIRTFSRTFYLNTYPDVAKSGLDPLQHYNEYGKKEGRHPLPNIPQGYTDAGYLICNPDVADAINRGIFCSGLDHFYEFGWKEGRKFSYTQVNTMSQDQINARVNEMVSGLKAQLNKEIGDIEKLIK